MTTAIALTPGKREIGRDWGEKLSSDLYLKGVLR